MDQVVPDGTAAKCDQKFCICTSHDNYHQIVAERIKNAKDTTVKPGTEEEVDEMAEDKEDGQKSGEGTDQQG